MKNLFAKLSVRAMLIAMAAGTAILAVSCGDKENKDEPDPVAALTVSADKIENIPAEGKEYKVMITSNVDWTLSNLPTWCEADAATGNGDREITLTVNANPGAARNHTIKIESETIKKSLYLAQLAGDDDPDPDVELDNQISFNGVIYDIDIAEQQYYGYEQFPEADGQNIDIYLVNGTAEESVAGIYLEMFSGEGRTLEAGRYELNQTQKPGTFSWGDFFLIDSEDMYPIAEGTVDVSVAGNIYTIIVDALCEGGQVLKAAYTGEMDLYDNTEPDWDSWEMPAAGILAYGDTEYEILDIYQKYYGDYFGSGYPNVDLGLFAFRDTDGDEPEEVEMNFPMIIPAGQTELPAGTYGLSMLEEPMNLLGGIIWLEDHTYFNYINKGRIKLVRDGEDYEVMITCIFAGGIRVRGYYTGPVWWYDESDEASGAPKTYIQRLAPGKEKLHGRRR